MASIEVKNASKRFGSDVFAVDDVSLHIDDGEFVVLVGPSGCGKTTLLRLVAGLEVMTAGTIELGGRDITHAPPKSRDTAMVFQDYALYPHMTVRENIGFGLRLRGFPKNDRAKRIEEVAQTLRLGDLLERRPGALSGGQRQRVAMGRAIARAPAAFLMDEPLSNLDAKLRSRLRAELARLREQLRTTTMYVTHDQTEALTLGHRVAVMRDGKILQVSDPKSLYDFPNSAFVASFIGSPSMNFVQGISVDDGVRVGSGHLASHAAVRQDRQVLVGIRPTALRLEADGPGLSGIRATIDVVEQLGHELEAIFVLDAPAPDQDTLMRLVGADEVDAVTSHRATWLGRFPLDTDLERGRKVRLIAEPSAVYLFDTDTGEAIPAAESSDYGRSGVAERSPIAHPARD